MSKSQLPEVWLRGPSPEFPALLQPVAHALMQAREEVNEIMEGFNGAFLWERAAGVASVGFHLQHLCGVPDRLFTYARGESLSKAQLNRLAAEQECPFDGCCTADLVAVFNQETDKRLDELKRIQEQTLTEYRGVGRRGLPSTVIGLLVHSAEHTMRHVGQLLVTVRMITKMHKQVDLNGD